MYYIMDKYISIYKILSLIIISFFGFIKRSLLIIDKKLVPFKIPLESVIKKLFIYFK